MPLPHEQLAELHKGLDGHQQRVAQLREGIRLAEEEVQFHMLLLSFARNEQTIAMLHEFHDSVDLLSDLARDPVQYCHEREVHLPDGVTLNAAEGEGVSAIIRYGAWEIEISWNRDAGLSVEPPKGPAACLSARFMSSVDPRSAPVDQ